MFSTLKKIAISCSLGLSLLCCSNNAFAALPLEGTTLKVGMSVAPPFVVIDGSISEPQGIDVEIVKELQRRTGFKLNLDQIEVMNFGELMNLAAQGKLDIIGGGISFTRERSRIFDFTPSYYTSKTALVALQDSGINGFEDLNGKSVAAELGSTAADLIPPEYEIHVNVDSTSTNFMAFYRVARGLSSAIVTDEPLALAYVQGWTSSKLEIKTLVDGSETKMGLLLKKKHKANKVLRSTMVAMIKDGTLDKILMKYLNKDYRSATGAYYEDNVRRYRLGTIENKTNKSKDTNNNNKTPADKEKSVTPSTPDSNAVVASPAAPAEALQDKPATPVTNVTNEPVTPASEEAVKEVDEIEGSNFD